ncbi:unnamed protein product [Penicillium salamii]|uniref:Uncharacterized protein n=1 Tax=Penicillium salamii TaxID=1612424 RepID=A0A9W4NVW0_9EURO|nr:unnamed protein product [Penicillium salamii]CAG8100003.1 unnamed protein product [Penicillium salamii]CAG8294738.1 unnamed protein product [Penicillium salamii]CAG8324015.1 unnamed protein product [Penicillium salamii]CAG8417766.1 unnamed protein product [Penicillium salamii]
MMPIPTRSASLREPRKHVSNIARPATKLSPNTTGSKEPVRSNNDNRPSPSTEAGKDHGPTARGRIPLPQRSNTQENSRTTGQLRLQPPSSRSSPRDPSPTRQEASPVKKQAPSDSMAVKPVVPPTRRQSIMRPSALKIPAIKSVTSASKSSAPSFAPPSPRKLTGKRSPVQPVQPPARRPPSPKKTEMLPPPRPARSASLRQPVSTGKIPPVVKGHTRHRSQLSQSTKPVEPAPSQRSRTISTYQRPSSPKKFSKPPTPTPGSAPQPDNLLIPSSWPDITALQTELLQLSLLHSNVMQHQAEWKSETESHLQNKYEGVAAQHRSLLADETQQQYQLNVHALGLWLSNCRENRGSHDFPEQIQILSQVLQEVSDMITENGLYSQIVMTFRTWLRQAEKIRQNRGPGCIDVAFVDPLPRSWKEPVQALSSQLELCSRQLQALDILGFGQVERVEQSALARVARTLVDLIQLMMQEIRALRTLEVEVVRSERDAVSLLASRLAGSSIESKAPRVGAWRC